MFYRMVKSDKWYALKIEDIEDDLENIQGFVEEGTVVALTDDLPTFADEMGISLEDIQIAE
jgi:hypothetical protein